MQGVRHVAQAAVRRAVEVGVAALQLGEDGVQAVRAWLVPPHLVALQPEHLPHAQQRRTHAGAGAGAGARHGASRRGQRARTRTHVPRFTRRTRRILFAHST
eukprot:5815635-Prymnesium_polylepis.1